MTLNTVVQCTIQVLKKLVYELFLDFEWCTIMITFLTKLGQFMEF